MNVDDTTIFCNFDNNCNEKVIHAELNRVYIWLCFNVVYLNVEKTKYNSFHRAQTIVIYPGLK